MMNNLCMLVGLKDVVRVGNKIKKCERVEKIGDRKYIKEYFEENKGKFDILVVKSNLGLFSWNNKKGWYKWKGEEYWKILLREIRNV